MSKPASQVNIGGKQFGRNEFFVIAGPCVIESRELALEVAGRLASMAQRLDLPLIFKSSFDKANRTSITSYPRPRPGRRLGHPGSEARKESGLPVISDIHNPQQAAPAAEVLDVLQIPAFLCRQTDLLVAAGQHRQAGQCQERPVPGPP